MSRSALTPVPPMSRSLPWSRLRIALTALLCCAALTACGSESGGDAADTGAADAGATADAAESPKDQCQNTADMTWLKADQGGGQSGRDLAREAAGDCGLGCLNHPAPDQCAIKCMLGDKGVKLSDGCAGCYGGIVLCTIEKCIAKCIDDAQATVCKDCQEDKGCNTPFYACTGNLD